MDLLPDVGPVGREDAEDGTDAVWRALASPWRRRILDALRDGPRTTGALVEILSTGRHQLLVHLTVLREADLVRTETRGRTRQNYLNPVPLRRIHDRWLSHYEALWSDVLLGLKADLESGAATPHGARPERTTATDKTAGEGASSRRRSTRRNNREDRRAG